MVSHMIQRHLALFVLRKSIQNMWDYTSICFVQYTSRKDLLTRKYLSHSCQYNNYSSSREPLEHRQNHTQNHIKMDYVWVKA